MPNGLTRQVRILGQYKYRMCGARLLRSLFVELLYKAIGEVHLVERERELEKPLRYSSPSISITKQHLGS